MNKDNKLIPELRFPEFENEGEWKESDLGSVVEMKGRIGYRGYTTEDIVAKGKGAITLSPSNFNENGRLNFEKCTYISWTKYEESPEIQLEEGQTVLVKTASVGKTAYVDELPEKATVNPQIVVLKPRTIHNRFLAFTVSHQNTQIQIRNNVGAGAIPNISQEIISKLKIVIPPDKEKKEQQKIASCLSSLDELIAAHNQKLELLKDHKKGLMQNLFPQEGEKVPKVRFKEFEKDGDWELKPFSKYIKLYRGSSPRPIVEYQTQDTSGVNWIKIGDTGSVTDFVIRSVSEKITPKGAEKSREVKKGELILANSMSYGSTYLLEIEGCIYDGWFVLREYDDVFNKQFLLQLLNSEYMQNQYKKLAAGGIVQNISSEIVYSTLLPKTSKPEQQKIASCLSSLDALITEQVEKIEQLQLHKKGLMQGLFPKIND